MKCTGLEELTQLYHWWYMRSRPRQECGKYLIKQDTFIHNQVHILLSDIIAVRHKYASRCNAECRPED